MVKIRMFEGIEEVFGSSKNNNQQMNINLPSRNDRPTGIVRPILETASWAGKNATLPATFSHAFIPEDPQLEGKKRH
jgi:hypothetical protein